jgi:regulator of PEP synthase PpsR (kinase-PPPase family)
LLTDLPMRHKHQTSLILDFTDEIMKENKILNYSNLDVIPKKIKNLQTSFKKYNCPPIDATRNLVERTAASVIKIFDIKKRKKK